VDFSVETVVALFCVAALCITLFLWRHALAHHKMRERWWRKAVRALSVRDFDGVWRLAEIMENQTSTASTREQENDAPDDLTRALRESARVLQRSDNENERARRDLEDVLSSLQDAVLVVDEEARLRFLNAAALQFFAVRIEEVLGAGLLEALPSFGLDAAVQSALHDGRSAMREVGFYLAAGGGRRDILLRVAPVRSSGGAVSGAVAILQDLTEMRRLERVRREFVANASHELRTPVANIRAGAETILSDPEDAALVQRFLPRIITESERLSLLVSDLLDLARAEAGAEDAASTRGCVDLQEVAARVVQSLSDKAARSGIKLYLDAVGDARLRGDAASLEQVAFNLLDNALMYTPSGGHVSMRVWGHEEGVAGEDTPCVVRLEICDTGIGIPADDLEHIFERFYRVDKARSRMQGGTGLGLAIVKHIVENHGGHVAVQSERGNGSTFTVTLPAL
jgi:two-component system phosphate regulon sensor histidine kinase PhoR